MREGGWSWIVIYTTSDEWMARLIKAAMAAQGIRCKLDRSRRGDYIVSVPDVKELDALEVLNRVEMAISEHAMERLLEREGRSEEMRGFVRERREEPSPIPRAVPTAVEKVVIASREGVGEIVHYIDRGYELRVGPEPYYMVEEARWAEFTDFSAQRHEFLILLRTEYPRLYKWLKQNKLMGEFIRLVESTYRDVPPPRPRRESNLTLKQKLIIWAVVIAGAVGAFSALMIALSG